MNRKNIVVAGISGGIVLLLIMAATSYLVSLVIPTNISDYGGMRSFSDPIMTLFYLYPFVVAFAAAIIFDITRDCLKGTQVQKGLMFGGMLLVIMALPSLYVMVTSMTWPLDFYVSTVFWQIVSFPLVGILYARIWNI